MRQLFINIIRHFFIRRCKIFTLGEGTVERYTIIEMKSFFSIYLHCIATNCQDRFHTHAFSAVGWTLSGGYLEEVADGLNIKETKIVTIGMGWRRIPRLYNHRLLKALPNTATLLFAGRYEETWTEQTNEWFRILGEGSKELVKFNK